MISMSHPSRIQDSDRAADMEYPEHEVPIPSGLRYVRNRSRSSVCVLCARPCDSAESGRLDEDVDAGFELADHLIDAPEGIRKLNPIRNLSESRPDFLAISDESGGVKQLS